MLKIRSILLAVSLMYICACSDHSDDVNWAEAKKTHTIIEHLQDFPQCRHRQEAENIMFDDCKTSAFACSLYIQTFDNGVPAHAVEVDNRLARACLSDEKLTCSWYVQWYVRQGSTEFSRGAHVAEVEEHLWERCQQHRTGACSDYFTFFPNGPHRQEALQKLNVQKQGREQLQAESEDLQHSLPSYTDCRAWAKVINKCQTHRGYDPTSAWDRALVDACAKLKATGCLSIP